MGSVMSELEFLFSLAGIVIGFLVVLYLGYLKYEKVSSKKGD